MTKYILHGGRTSIPSEDNNNFFKEIVKGLIDSAKILLIYFARDESEWNPLFEEDKKNFMRANTTARLIFLLASENKVIDQIKEADVIYMRGGDTSKLRDKLNRIENLELLFKNKTIVGSSAGAYILSKYYFSNDRGKIDKGLGILPIKTFCHYSNDQKEILRELESYGENLKTYAIPEQKYIVLSN